MSKKVDPVYQKKIEDLKVEGESFADAAMKDVYLEQKVALDELHAMIGKIYIDHSKEGFLNISATQKATITTDVKAKLKAMGVHLGQSEIEQVTAILGSVFKLTYYKTAFTMESGMKANLKFNILKKEFVDAAVNHEFKGELFSDRIWANKAGMIDQLQSTIVGAMKGDITIDRLGRDIRDRFNVTAYESQRLVRTENARIQSQAGDDIARSTGVDQQMYSATLDGKTSPECAVLDGKIYGVDDSDKVVPPENHPMCRCCLINVPYAGWSPSARKDNESGKIIDYKNYEDWANSKGVD